MEFSILFVLYGPLFLALVTPCVAHLRFVLCTTTYMDCFVYVAKIS
jgi:hypothetical protein